MCCAAQCQNWCKVKFCSCLNSTSVHTVSVYTVQYTGATTSVSTYTALYGFFADPICHKTPAFQRKFCLRKLSVCHSIVLCSTLSTRSYYWSTVLENMPLLLHVGLIMSRALRCDKTIQDREPIFTVRFYVKVFHNRT